MNGVGGKAERTTKRQGRKGDFPPPDVYERLISLFQGIPGHDLLKPCAAAAIKLPRKTRSSLPTYTVAAAQHSLG